METETYKFSDITVNFDRIRVPLSAKQRAGRKGPYRYYGAQGVIDFVDDFLFDGDYLLIAEDGENLKSNKKNIAQLVHGRFWVNNHAHIIQTNHLCDLRYLYYLINSMDLSGFITGSAQPKLSQINLNSISLKIPDIKIQRKISAILGSLDDKIALNTRINDNLAALLHTHYQSYFGCVVTQGRSGVLSDICEFSKGRIAVSTVSLEDYFSTENMLPNKTGATRATTLPTVAQTTRCRKGDTLISNIRPYFKKIYYCQTDCACSSDVLCFVPRQQIYSAFLFCSLYDDHFFDYMLSGCRGTKMPRGDKQQIMAYSIPVPSDKSLCSFNEVAAPILTLIEQNRKESKSLASMRDTLLPRLMSGELDVSGLDI